MVQHLHVHQGQRVAQRAGQRFVGMARLGHARRVVVRENRYWGSCRTRRVPDPALTPSFKRKKRPIGFRFVPVQPGIIWVSLRVSALREVHAVPADTRTAKQATPFKNPFQPRKRLTDTAIQNAKPADRPYKGTDSGGLYIEIRPTGAKLWRYRYRIGGKENLYALGEYGRRAPGETEKQGQDRRAGGVFTLEEAHTERDRCRALVRQGIHPSHARKLEVIRRVGEGANTFQAVATEWLQQNEKHWTASTKEQRERLLKREVFPKIGKWPMRDITPAHVLSLLKNIEKTAPSFAVLAQQAISATFRLAVSTLRADTDPTAPLRGAIKTPPTKHKTPLEESEIPGFYKALDEYPGAFQTKVGIQLLWLTLARTNELLRSKWEEIDLERAEWRIPGARMKGRTIAPHIVPLPRQAIDLLRRLYAVTGSGEYVFPNRSDLRRPAAVTLFNKCVSAIGYAGKFSPHAIRTTGSTMLNEAGFRGDWIERQLAHKDRNETRATYNGAKYLQQRAEMMQQWADSLDAMCRGAGVIPIFRKQA